MPVGDNAHFFPVSSSSNFSVFSTSSIFSLKYSPFAPNPLTSAARPSADAIQSIRMFSILSFAISSSSRLLLSIEFSLLMDCAELNGDCPGQVTQPMKSGLAPHRRLELPLASCFEGLLKALCCRKLKQARLKGFSLSTMALWVFGSIVYLMLFLCQKPRWHDQCACSRGQSDTCPAPDRILE